MGCRALIVLTIALLSGILFHTPGIAQSRSFRLGVPDVIAETGFLQYLLPRFSLKTGIRIEIVGDTAPSELRLSEGASGPSSPGSAFLAFAWFAASRVSTEETRSRVSLLAFS